MSERKQRKREEQDQKETEVKAKKHRYFAWFLVIICGIMTFEAIPSFAMILFAAETVLLLPITKIDELWEKIQKGKPKWIKNTILGAVFIIACLIVPTSNMSSQLVTSTPKQIISTEATEVADAEIISTETTEEISTETVLVSETETKSETDIETISKESNISDANSQQNDTEQNSTNEVTSVSLSNIPAYSGSPYVAINDNVPFFTDSEMTTTAFENYSNLDNLGRCGVAYANVCTEIMPTEERGEIGSVKPSGWHTVKYDVVSGKYLYNRCHLIGYQLSAENANTKNLITGTRYLNVEGMLPFENMVADYAKETNNHVLYRVTPMFAGNNLVASGVLMEAKSVEDNGDGILFNVYCYNVQPGVIINYETGDSSLDGTYSEQTKQEPKNTNSANTKSSTNGSSGNTSTTSETQTSTTASEQVTDNNTAAQETPASTSTDTTSNGSVIVHITDTGSKYHNAGCRYLKSDREVTLDEAKAMGLEPCSVCNPPQ